MKTEEQKAKKHELSRKWALANVERTREIRRKSAAKHSKSARKRYKAWKELNKERVRIAGRLRYKNDPNFRLLCGLRNRLTKVLGRLKSDSARSLLGCPITEFRIYIESKFETGMTWENHGTGKDKWHLDHIVPCALFDFSKPDHQKRCFHFSNYQPMWEPDNIAKSANSDGQLRLV